MRNFHCIEDLLAGPGRIGVLRTLSGATEPLTGRQIAKLAGLSHSGTNRFLALLAEDGLVNRTAVGSAMLHELDRSNALVRAIVLPLFAAEHTVLQTASTPLSDPRAIDVHVNPAVRPHLTAVEEACRRHHVVRSALFGSATQADPGVVPNDLDVLVTFAPLEPQMKAREYAELVAELEQILGMPVDVMVSTAVRNPYLAQEIERTKVVLYEVA